ncbi:hypothetical protein MMC26_003782 [Xylographa opegraphella]|nr:hypothetical protein [Xylographa opegraphella]
MFYRDTFGALQTSSISARFGSIRPENTSTTVAKYIMDLPNILNSKGPAAAAAAAEHQLQQQLAQVVNAEIRNLSDSGSERGMPSHVSSNQSLLPLSNMVNDARFSAPDHHPDSMAMLPNSFSQQNGLSENGYNHPRQRDTGQPNPSLNGSRLAENGSALKAYACLTCQKGFARRSDLARHERIHSGIRPHVCEHPGCGKQFIQRSALTVHARVHTGEKPHMSLQRLKLPCEA